MLNITDITKVLKELGSANALLNKLVTDDVLSQMSDEQVDQIKEALDISDPEKLKKKALELTKKYK